MRHLAVVVALMVVAGCAPVAPPASSSPSDSSEPVWLVAHGWHVGLVFERARISTRRWPESRELGEFTYVEVGWGDADYYPRPQGTIGLALRAAFGSRGSVLFVAAFDTPAERLFTASEIIEVRLSATGSEALAGFVHDAYARDPEGRPIVVAPVPYGSGGFYRATGRYGLLENSNTWTARALHAAGCPIDPGTTATAGRLLAQARDFGRLIRGPAGETVIAPAGPRSCR